jgi:hypothetical protein
VFTVSSCSSVVALGWAVWQAGLSNLDAGAPAWALGGKCARWCFHFRSRLGSGRQGWLLSSRPLVVEIARQDGFWVFLKLVKIDRVVWEDWFLFVREGLLD